MVAQPGPRTLYDAFGSTPADVVLFMDGSAPDPRLHEDRTAPVPRIGWVAFVRGSRGVRSQVFFGSYTIPSEPRTTQVSIVELFGAVAALETMAPRIRGASLLLLVDAEAAQGALVKGYSSVADFGTFYRFSVPPHLTMTSACLSTVSRQTQTLRMDHRGRASLTSSPEELSGWSQTHLRGSAAEHFSGDRFKQT